MKIRKVDRQIRHTRIRSKLSGTAGRPRFYVYRSNQHIYGALVDDTQHKTLLSVADTHLKDAKGTKTEKALKLGKLIGEKAKEKGIKAVVFDRAGYLYHGRVKALANGAREGGLEF